MSNKDGKWFNFMDNIRKCLSLNDVLLVPRNSENDHLSDAFVFMDYSVNGVNKQTIPVINAPMDTVCSPELISYLNIMGFPTSIHRWFSCVEKQINYIDQCINCRNSPFETSMCFVSVGNKIKWNSWIDSLLDYRHKNSLSFGILVDVANGDTKQTVDTVTYLRNKNSKLNIMAGNVATKSGFSRLQDAGSNFIRVGIGGGASCSTREQCGMGLPTLTSILDCSKIKDSSYLVADGGIENNGDIIKCINAGADMVMCGKLFAATSLSGAIKYDKTGEITEDINSMYECEYRGMASEISINSLNSIKTNTSIEGKSGRIKYTGTTEKYCGGLIGNMQSSMSYYAGCKNWKEFRKKVKMVEITSQGWEESKTRLR